MDTIKGALFDLDGVIIDSEGLYTRFWEIIGKEYQLPSPTFAYDIKGCTLRDILDRYFPDNTVQAELTKRIHDYEDTMIYPVFDYVVEYIGMLRNKGVRTAIVTSSDAIKMGYLFSQHPELEPLFDIVVNGSMVTRSKPDPEGYLKAAELIKCDITDCVVFEDSFQGLEAGRRSGAKVCALATTNSAEQVKPLADIVINSFAELLK